MNDDMQEMESLAAEAGLSAEGDCGCGCQDVDLSVELGEFEDAGFEDSAGLDQLEAEGAAVTADLATSDAGLDAFADEDVIDEGFDDADSLDWGDHDGGEGDSCAILDIARRNPGLKITVSF